MAAAIAILGCGYTGLRVARRMAARGHMVFVTSRRPDRLPLDDRVVRLRLDSADRFSLITLRTIPPGSLVLHSVPMVRHESGQSDPTPWLIEGLRGLAARVVYLSTTGVYGAQLEVNEHTRPAPGSEGAKLRVAAEQAVLAGPWSGMVLRPAAIYGPGRGIHVSLPRGEYRLAGDGGNWVSRIHVDDLAALCCAALTSRQEGCWPVADLEPARSIEIASYVAKLAGCPMPGSSPAAELHETRRANRKVDGSEVFRRLGVRLVYPSFREGIAASLDPNALKC